MKPLRLISIPVGVGVGRDGVGVGTGVGVAVGPGVGIWNGVGITCWVAVGIAAVGTETNGVIVGVATLAVGEGSLVSELPEQAAKAADKTNTDDKTAINFRRFPFLAK